jgi:hypothetical protein
MTNLDENTQAIVDETVRLGTEAEYILSTDAYRKAMEELDKGLMLSWAEGAFKTPEEREDCFNRIRGARMFRDRMNSMIDNMKVAKARVDRAQQAEKTRR